MTRDIPEDVIRHIRSLRRWGPAVRKLLDGQHEEVEVVDIARPKGAALFLAWLTKGSAHERAADGPCPLTEATLDEVAERCQWEELATVLRGGTDNPREQAMSRAREAKDIVRETVEEDGKSLADAVDALKNRPMTDGAGAQTFRNTVLSETTDPDDFFDDPRPNWLREAQQEARVETEAAILDALSTLLCEQQAVGVAEIHEEIEKDVTKKWLRQVLVEKAEEWGMEKIDHPNPDDARGNPQAYIPEGEEP